MGVEELVGWSNGIPLAVSVIFGGVIVIRIFVSEFKKHFNQNRLEQLGDLLGLRNASFGEISGEIDGFPVRLAVDKKVPGIQLKISMSKALFSDRGLPEGLVIRKENPKNIVPDIQSGDREFDDSVRILSTDASHVMAVLDEQTRVDLAELVRLGFSVFDGIATCPVPPGLGQKTFVKGVVRLVARFGIPKGMLAERLAHRFETERRVETRLNLLWALIRDYPENPLSVSAAEKAVRATDPGICFLGALFLGEKGNSFLEKIWKSTYLPISDSWNYKRDSPTLITAVSLATSKNTPIETKRLLQGFLAALGSSDPDLLILAVEGLKRVRRMGAVALIARIGETSQHPRVLEAVVKALGLRGASRQQPFLIGLLPHKNSTIVYYSAIALGKYGSVRAVPPLLNLAKRSKERLIRRTAEKAIAQIQARRGEGVRGDLSLSEENGESGGVSLIQEGGELSKIYREGKVL